MELKVGEAMGEEGQKFELVVVGSNASEVEYEI